MEPIKGQRMTEIWRNFWHLSKRNCLRLPMEVLNKPPNMSEGKDLTLLKSWPKPDFSNCNEVNVFGSCGWKICLPGSGDILSVLLIVKPGLHIWEESAKNPYYPHLAPQHSVMSQVRGMRERSTLSMCLFQPE